MMDTKLRGFFNKCGCNFDNVSEIGNKGYDVMISVHDGINKNISRYLNYTVDVIMLPKFGNSSIPV